MAKYLYSRRTTLLALFLTTLCTPKLEKDVLNQILVSDEETFCSTEVTGQGVVLRDGLATPQCGSCVQRALSFVGGLSHLCVATS